MTSSLVSPLGFLTGSPLEWIIIFIVALIVFGPKRLPEVGRQLGKAMRDFRKIADEVTGATKSVHEEINSVTGQLRAEVESARRMDAPARYDQRDEHLMAPAPQLTAPTPAADRSGGLRLSTLPDAGKPDGEEPVEPKG